MDTDEGWLDYKNFILVPLFHRIRGIVKAIKMDEAEYLKQDYTLAKLGLEKSYEKKKQELLQADKSQVKDESQINEIDSKLERETKKLTDLYEILISKIKQDYQLSSNKITVLKDKLMLIFNLVYLWDQYTYVLKLGKEDVEELKNNQINNQPTPPPNKYEMDQIYSKLQRLFQ